MKERIKVDVNWDDFFKELFMFLVKLLLINLIVVLVFVFIAVVIFFATF